MAGSPDFPRSLEPRQIALPVALSRGALIGLPHPSAPNKSTYEILRFQYNPDTVTRARTGQWERKLDKKTSKAAQQKQSEDAARGGAIKSKSEVISFKLVFDAAELMLADYAAASKKGVMPELSVLERFALGPDQIPDPPKKDNEFALITLTPTEAILVLGPRNFPGVITQMNIVEQRFTPELVPVRAEVDIRFRVLEAAAIAVHKDTQKIFEELLKQREAWAGEAVATAQGDVKTAIGKAITARVETRKPLA
jgi:Contractile injection system tube protein